jgi:tRNA threonylcarbamoyladenosine biosynthesis protein TsaB
MKILALEFSSAARSAAVLEAVDHKPVLRAERTARQGEHTGLTLIDQALREANVRRQEIELIAVGLGPGSYAGIRAAIAIAQGWQLAANARACGVPSIDVIAAEAHMQGTTGEIMVIVDAQRGELYSALYTLGITGPAEKEPLRIIPASSVPGGLRVIGPEAARLAPGGIDLYPRAAVLGMLALKRAGSAQGAETLEPIYLRETAFVKAMPARGGGKQNA